MQGSSTTQLARTTKKRKDIESMKVINAILATAAAVLLSGCINLYTRCPGTDSEIASTYQSTRLSISVAYVVAFQQIITGWQPSI